MSQHDWKKGDFAVRKGKLCEVTHIDFALHPPAVTVKMLDGGHEVGTEFSKLTKIPAPKWSCGVCTFDNNLNDQVCTVCMQGKRTNAVYRRALERVENAIYNQPNSNNKNENENNNNSSKKENRATHWKCTLCTFNNGMDNDECQMCYTIRSKDAQLIYPNNNSNIENNKDMNNKNNNDDNNKNENENKNNESNKIDNEKEEKLGENGKQENKQQNEGDSNNINNDNKEKEKEKDKNESDENVSNDSEWTLIDKTELIDENENENENGNENRNNNSEKNEKSSNKNGDPYMEVE